MNKYIVQYVRTRLWVLIFIGCASGVGFFIAIIIILHLPENTDSTYVPITLPAGPVFRALHIMSYHSPRLWTDEQRLKADESARRIKVLPRFYSDGAHGQGPAVREPAPGVGSGIRIPARVLLSSVFVEAYQRDDHAP